MRLSPCQKLRSHEILAPIGNEGMGEIRNARDPRVGSDVPIKVSNWQFSESVGRNSPVMEYVEGTPLKGPPPLKHAVQYAGQICTALDQAHKKRSPEQWSSAAPHGPHSRILHILG